MNADERVAAVAERFGRRREPRDGAVAAARHRRAESERRGLDARQRAHALEQLLVELLPAGAVVDRAGQVDADREQPGRVDADAGVAQPIGASDHQARAGK